MNPPNQHQVAVLNKAALDAAIELDWIKNDANISPAQKDQIINIIERVHTASQAISSATPCTTNAPDHKPECLCVECCYAEEI